MLEETLESRGRPGIRPENHGNSGIPHLLEIFLSHLELSRIFGKVRIGFNPLAVSRVLQLPADLRGDRSFEKMAVTASGRLGINKCRFFSHQGWRNTNLLLLKRSDQRIVYLLIPDTVGKPVNSRLSQLFRII